MQVRDRRIAFWSGRGVELDTDPIEAMTALAHQDEWQFQSVCAQTDPEAFFPEKGGSTKEAKSICQGCEVRAECLQAALDNDERFGIWGGFSERERRKIKRGLAEDLTLSATDRAVISAVILHRCTYCREEIPAGAGRFCSDVCKSRQYALDHPTLHGTEKMYRRHIRMCEDPCTPCRIAMALARDERRSA